MGVFFCYQGQSPPELVFIVQLVKLYECEKDTKRMSKERVKEEIAGLSQEKGA